MIAHAIADRSQHRLWLQKKHGIIISREVDDSFIVGNVVRP